MCFEKNSQAGPSINVCKNRSGTCENRESSWRELRSGSKVQGVWHTLFFPSLCEARLDLPNDQLSLSALESSPATGLQLVVSSEDLRCGFVPREELLCRSPVVLPIGHFSTALNSCWMAASSIGFDFAAGQRVEPCRRSSAKINGPA